ncbi:MAG: response regulator receiver sensor signal transduction histidine kinase [Polaromonas sp.]|nr:response regulator receiver sensor signal transduction histidine kinase [Polaromonas sp.]
MLNDNNTKLLIVDDLPENLLALEAVIRRKGRTVFQASSGEEALALLLEHEFALAILDVQMPGMNGFELAELMRGTEKTRHVPIVFVTAAGKESNYAFKGYETGAVDFLYKPLDVQAVQSKVSVFVELYEQRKETRRQMAALEKSRKEQEALLAQLETTRQELQKAVRIRDDFMSVVAHELLTPLNTLFLETQQRKLELERGNMAMFEKIGLARIFEGDQRQIQSMVELIDDMLDVSRIRNKQLLIRPRHTELSAILKRAVDQLASQALAAGSPVTVHAEALIEGHWDEFRIQQVVVNLLGNALRHGEGKPVDIFLSSLSGSARIEVIDQGKGIAIAEQGRIFEQFERSPRSAGPGVFSMGLYISRQLVQAHGGTLELVNPQGKGSAFRVTLPLAAPAAAGA